jgi:hypothetical protein
VRRIIDAKLDASAPTRSPLRRDPERAYGPCVRRSCVPQPRDVAPRLPSRYQGAVGAHQRTDQEAEEAGGHSHLLAPHGGAGALERSARADRQRLCLFFSVFFGTFVVLLVFNAVDLPILDWLVFVTLRPKIVVLPGTEGAEGYGDYGFHFRAFLKGLAGSSVASLLACVLTALAAKDA